MHKAKVLVTGGSGFIGANLVRRLLAEDREIFIPMRKSSNLWRLEEVRDQVKLVDFDLLDQEVTQRALQKIRPRFIFHLATYGGYPSQQDERLIFETNLFGTINLVNAAAKTGFKKLVAAGTSSEYGAKNTAMKETDVLEPNTAYGASKAASTLYCQYRARQENLPIVIFRPFSVYGPGEEKTRLIPTLISRCSSGKELNLASPEVARDYVYVDDIIEAFLLALENGRVNGEILNLCSGRQTTIKEIVELVMRYTGSNSKLNWNEPSVSRSYDVTTWVGDPGKAKKLLGWEAVTSLEEGIRKTIEWFKQHVKYYI